MNITNDKNERINSYFKKINESKEGIKNENFEKKILYDKNGNKEFEGQKKIIKLKEKELNIIRKELKYMKDIIKMVSQKGKE